MSTIESLSQKITIMEARLEALESQKSKPAKGLKASKAPKDPNAPKKEANWFVQSLGNIRITLAPLIDAHNSALPEGGKKITGVCATQVGRILKEGGLMTKLLQPTEAQITEAFQTFLHTPLPVKTEEWKAASLSKKDSSASSVASTEKPSKASKPEEVPEAEVIETEEVNMDIGKGGSKPYERIVYQGVTYIYTADGENFLGEWNEATKKLNPNGKDIKNA